MSAVLTEGKQCFNNPFVQTEQLKSFRILKKGPNRLCDTVKRKKGAKTHRNLLYFTLGAGNGQRLGDACVSCLVPLHLQWEGDKHVLLEAYTQERKEDLAHSHEVCRETHKNEKSRTTTYMFCFFFSVSSLFLFGCFDSLQYSSEHSAWSVTHVL